jgi:hypothetical protein
VDGEAHLRAAATGEGTAQEADSGVDAGSLGDG